MGTAAPKVPAQGVGRAGVALWRPTAVWAAHRSPARLVSQPNSICAAVSACLTREAGGPMPLGQRQSALPQGGAT